MVILIDSVDPGTWSATETEVSVVDFGGEATVTLGIEVDGQIRPLPVAMPQTPATASFSGAAPYTCDGGVLTATFDGVVATFDRIG